MVLKQRDDLPAHRAAPVWVGSAWWPCRAAWGVCGGQRRCWAVLGAYAGHVEEPVVAVLHVLEHLEQEGFPLTGRLFPLTGRLFPRLGAFELLLEQGDHVQVDVQRVNFRRQLLSNGLDILTSNGVSSV